MDASIDANSDATDCAAKDVGDYQTSKSADAVCGGTVRG